MALLITCLVLGAVLLGGFVVHIAVMLAASRKGAGLQGLRRCPPDGW